MPAALPSIILMQRKLVAVALLLLLKAILGPSAEADGKRYDCLSKYHSYSSRLCSFRIERIRLTGSASTFYPPRPASVPAWKADWEIASSVPSSAPRNIGESASWRT